MRRPTLLLSSLFAALAAACSSASTSDTNDSSPTSDTGTATDSGAPSDGPPDDASDGSLGAPTVMAIAAGGDTTCAVMKDGTVRCWGADLYGQLGSGQTPNPTIGACAGGVSACKNTPQVVAGLSGVTAIAMGDHHVCALENDKTVVCWGGADAGQLATGSTQSCPTLVGGGTPCSTSPVGIAGVAGVSDLFAGGRTSCAKSSDGTITCWGSNEAGQLGVTTADICAGTTPNVSCAQTPVALPWAKDASGIAIGDLHLCALANGVKCAGKGDEGELGDGKSTTSATPVAADEGNPNVLQIVAGSAHTCLVWSGVVAGATSNVDCWGDNGHMQIAKSGSTVASPTSYDPITGGGDVTVFAGGNMVFAQQDGTWFASGANDTGQLGDGTTTDHASTTPTGISGTDTVLAIGNAHVCALTSGAVKCWGSNGSGQVGDGSFTDRATPVAITF